MRIGELAARAGVSRDTLRHYERLGLLPAVVRGASGYRQYGDTAVRRVLLIRRALACGFSLKSLASFLREREGGGAPCRAVREEAASRLAELVIRIRTLQSQRRALRELLGLWDARLAVAPRGQPLHLLDDLADLPAAATATPRRRGVAHVERARGPAKGRVTRRRP